MKNNTKSEEQESKQKHIKQIQNGLTRKQKENMQMFEKQQRLCTTNMWSQFIPRHDLSRHTPFWGKAMMGHPSLNKPNFKTTMFCQHVILRRHQRMNLHFLHHPILRTSRFLKTPKKRNQHSHNPYVNTPCWHKHRTLNTSRSQQIPLCSSSELEDS